MEEIWKPWPENNNYFISNLGRVKGIKGTILKTQISQRGYETVSLRKAGNRTPNRYNVHLLVLRTFQPIEEHQEGTLVGDHIDGNKTNNTITNLRWVTPKENNLLKTQNRAPINNIVNELINTYGYEGTLKLLQSLIK